MEKLAYGRRTGGLQNYQLIKRVAKKLKAVAGSGWSGEPECARVLLRKNTITVEDQTNATKEE